MSIILKCVLKMITFTFNSMLTDEKSLSICPSWSPAIESILTANPSLKFCIRGRLDISDLIGANFYISKKHWKDFKVFRYIIKCEVSPLYPMIIVNFGHTYVVPTEVVRIGNVSSRPTNASLTSTTSEADEDWVYCRRPIDVDLPKYLKKLRDSLEVNLLYSNYLSKYNFILHNFRCVALWIIKRIVLISPKLVIGRN